MSISGKNAAEESGSIRRIWWAKIPQRISMPMKSAPSPVLGPLLGLDFDQQELDLFSSI